MRARRWLVGGVIFTVVGGSFTAARHQPEPPVPSTRQPTLAGSETSSASFSAAAERLELVELRKTRASRSRPLSRPSLRKAKIPKSSGAAAWANTRAAIAVAECESGRDGSARSHTGKYRGKWQMDADFWRTYGGLKFASSPDRASVAQQDIVAYRGYLARGWQPWTCARIVGII